MSQLMKTVTRKGLRRVATLGLSASLLVGGAAALAPMAAAVGGHPKCTNDDGNFNGKIVANNVNLRKEPGTTHASYGQLTKGTRIMVDCYRQPDVTKQPWLYAKVNSGSHNGMWGWVRDDLATW